MLFKVHCGAGKGLCTVALTSHMAVLLCGARVCVNILIWFTGVLRNPQQSDMFHFYKSTSQISNIVLFFSQMIKKVALDTGLI